MANYCSFMVSERCLLTDDPERVRAVLARFGVGEEGDYGLYFDVRESDAFWLGGYDPHDPLDRTIDDVLDELGDDLPPEPELPPGTTLAEALQPVIRHGTAWVYHVVGYEKLRYASGHVVVVTRDTVAAGHLGDIETRLVEEALGERAA